MKALVTGANGFLGSWLTRRLLAEGHEVSALVRKNSDLSELDKTRPRFVYGDVTDRSSLLENFRGHDVVFHLAGAIAYRKSKRELMEQVNVEGTKNVLEACEIAGISKLLHLSSVVAIGASKTPLVLNEESPYLIGSLDLAYFETKRKAEALVQQAALGKRLHAVCVNPSTIYGFGDAKKGSRKNQIKVARGELGFYTSGGVNVLAAEDAIDGILLALEKGKSGERYILASENMTIENLFQQIAMAAGVKAPDRKMPDWLLHSLGIVGDTLSLAHIDIGLSQENAYTATMFHWFSSEKAKRELGFNPKPSAFAIENSVRWMRDNGYLK